MRSSDKGTTLRSVHRKLGLQFILSELDLATTFCQIGLTTRDFLGAERNAGNARAALQAANRAKEQVELTQQERQIASVKTAKLLLLLKQLECRLVAVW